jgi:hypothetical protein
MKCQLGGAVTSDTELKFVLAVKEQVRGGGGARLVWRKVVGLTIQ